MSNIKTRGGKVICHKDREEKILNTDNKRRHHYICTYKSVGLGRLYKHRTVKTQIFQRMSQ